MSRPLKAQTTNGCQTKNWKNCKAVSINYNCIKQKKKLETNQNRQIQSPILSADKQQEGATPNSQTILCVYLTHRVHP